MRTSTTAALAFLVCSTSAFKQAERPLIKIFGSNPFRTGLTDQDYLDDGADCSDHVPFDQNLNFQVASGGDVVRLDRPGTYIIKYYCSNRKGVAALPVNRQVIVAKAFNHGCTNVKVSGQSVGSYDFDKMGTYALTKDSSNGRPVYHQTNAMKGKQHYLYYFASDRQEDKAHVWSINDINPANDDIDLTTQMGLRVSSMAIKPEKITGTTDMWKSYDNSTKKWESCPYLEIHCTDGKDSEASKFSVIATIQMSGYNAKAFETKANEELFTHSVAESLDVASEDVSIRAVQTDGGGVRRRLGASDVVTSEGSTDVLDVTFQFDTSDPDVEASVLKTLKGEMAEQLLFDHMNDNGLHVPRVLVDRSSIEANANTGLLSSTGMLVAASCVGVMAVVGVAYKAGKASTVNGVAPVEGYAPVDTATQEETRGIIGS